MTVKTGKYLVGVLRPGKAFGAFAFEATLVDGSPAPSPGKRWGTERGSP